MNVTNGVGYTFTMGRDCLIVRRGVAPRQGMYRVIFLGFMKQFVDNFDAVVDDFGNLVRVEA